MKAIAPHFLYYRIRIYVLFFNHMQLIRRWAKNKMMTENPCHTKVFFNCSA